MRRPRPSLLALCLSIAALALAGCSSSQPTASGAPPTGTSADPAPSDSPLGSESGSPTEDAATTDSFPITVSHAFGATVIESEPKRVVALGWGTPEAAIALGVVPVAVEEQVWTVGEGNHLPWIEEAVATADAELPEILPNDFTTPAYEQIIALQPDLILAHYSGYGREQYELLSDIAPTIAYPEQPWSTPWTDVIEITATALGRSAAGDQLLADLEGFFAEGAEAHPEFQGVTVANVWDGDGVVSVYTSADPRVSMMTDLGFEIADSVDALDTDDAPANFFYELSYEELDKLEADLIVSYHSTAEEAEAFLAKPELQAIPAVANGQVAQVIGNEYISAVSPPNALSIPWGMPNLIDTLAEVLGG